MKITIPVIIVENTNNVINAADNIKDSVISDVLAFPDMIDDNTDFPLLHFIHLKFGYTTFFIVSTTKKLYKIISVYIGNNKPSKKRSLLWKSIQLDPIYEKALLKDIGIYETTKYVWLQRKISK